MGTGVAVGSGVGVFVGVTVGTVVAVGTAVAVGVVVDVGAEVAVGTFVEVGVEVATAVGAPVGITVDVPGTETASSVGFATSMTSGPQPALARATRMAMAMARQTKARFSPWDLARAGDEEERKSITTTVVPL